MKIFNFLALVLVVIMTGGCAVTLPTNSYTPQNFVRTTGKVDMGSFTYTPFVQGIVKKPNQIQSTAAGSIYISTDVSDFVKRGTALELEKSGIILDSLSPVKLDGNVLEFKIDDLGYSVTWYYKIQYIIVQKSDSKILFDKSFSITPKKGGKFQQPIDYANVVNEIILDGYDQFIRDPQVKMIFENTLRPSPKLN